MSASSTPIFQIELQISTNRAQISNSRSITSIQASRLIHNLHKVIRVYTFNQDSKRQSLTNRFLQELQSIQINNNIR